MNTPIITITKEHIGGVDETFMIADKQWLANICNKAIQIALAEQICGEDFQYFSFGVKYRATKQAQPEPVVAYPRPYDPNLYCQVSKDGEPAIRMLRTEAKELFNKTHTTHVWTVPSCQGLTAIVSDEYLCAFDQQGIYNYSTKALKQVKWEDVPVGVAVTYKYQNNLTKGTWYFQGVNKNLNGILLTTKTADYCVQQKYEMIELAPASEQPWIAVQDDRSIIGLSHCFNMAGLTYEFDAMRYKITGIAQGWKL